MADKEGTERASMVWPKGVKDQIRERAGEQTMTEYVLDAIRVHLGQSADSATLEKQLRETEFFAQRVADLAVMGGNQSDRLQSLMELEFPSWIATDGWPEAAATLVAKAHLPREPVEERPKASAGGQAPDEGGSSSPVGVGSEPEVAAAPPAEQQDEQPWRITESTDPRQDLFARLKNKVGADVPGLTTASRLPTPPKPPVEPEIDSEGDDAHGRTIVLDGPSALSVDDDDQADEAEVFKQIAAESGLCPVCADELIEGECWTCS